MFPRALSIVAFLAASPVFAAPLTLTPADPQPDAGDLNNGLAVSYADANDVRTLEAAEDVLKGARAGPALRGLSYDDIPEGDPVLTSKKTKKVAAEITGFIRFEAAGTFEVDVFSNDGVVASIGGQEVAFYDEIHACEPAGVQEVEVPEAGWYALEITYFQRKGGSCLAMDWNAGGKMGPVPDAAFAHSK